MGFIQGYSIERVHLQFCKRLLGVQRTTQNGFVYGELGRHTFQMFRYITLVLYWIKILHTDDNKYIRKVYNMLKHDMEVYPDKPNWCTILKDLLFTLGMYDAWYFQEIGNTDYILYIVKQRLCDQFVQNWQGRLQQSNRARCYKIISSFKLQPY